MQLRVFMVATACGLLCALALSTAKAEVKCSCETIKADGEGNSSCSTNESGGRCTIDYNLFAERETRAQDILKELADVDVISFPNLNSQQSIIAAERDNTMQQLILLYLSIAATDQLISHPDTVPNDMFSRLVSVVEQRSNEISQAFSRDSIASQSQTVLVDDGEVVLSSGCMSVDLRDAIVMFKASWSPFRAVPRCN